MLAVLFCFVEQAMAQGNFGSEKELRKEATSLFNDDKYAEALPLYSQLLSLYPKDPDFNYRYGVCLLYATEDKEKPLSYLNFALGKEGVDDDIYYHLGRAFHLNYRFDDAIKQYLIFKDKKSKTSSRLQVDMQIKMCQNGKRLLKNITDLTVLERREFNAGEYFRGYDFSNTAGKLVVKPDDFKTAYDAKKQDKSTIVVRQTSEEIYFSSYGDDGKNGRDIYRVFKQPNFTWTKPVNIGPTINTPYDEDFPYITPDGKTLYFCSKGHNSMGGYDIFKSELNPTTQLWGPPQNLDYAINTPDDDIQYVVDPSTGLAVFSSKRTSPEGKIIVYKIKTDRVPVTEAIVRGKFINEIEPDKQQAKITVKNVATGKLVGSVTSSQKDGKYRLNLVNNNKFEFTVEQLGHPPIVQIVEIPPMDEFRPLKQEVVLKKEAGEDKIIIYNFFGDTLEDQAEFMASLLKEKARLESISEDKPGEEILSQAGKQAAPIEQRQLSNRNEFKGDLQKEQGELKDNDLVKMAYSDAGETQKEADEAREKSGQAWAFANLKSNIADQKTKEAVQLENEAAAQSDVQSKESKKEEALNKRKEAESASQQAILAYNLAKDFEKDANLKQRDAEQAISFAKELDAAVKSGSAEAMSKLEDKIKEMEKEDNEPAGSGVVPESLGKEIDDVSKSIGRETKWNEQLKQELESGLADEKAMQEQILATKNRKDKNELEEKLKLLNEETRSKQQQINASNVKINNLREKENSLKAEAEVNRQLMNEISSTPKEKLDNVEEAEKAGIASRIEQLKEGSTGASASLQNKEQQQGVAQLNSEKSNADGQKSNSTELQKSDTSSSGLMVQGVSEQKSAAPPQEVASNNTAGSKEKYKESEKLKQRSDSIQSVLLTETSEAKIESLLKESESLKSASADLQREGLSLEYAENKRTLEGNNEQISLKERELSESDRSNYEAYKSDLARADELFITATTTSDPVRKDSLMHAAVSLQQKATAGQQPLITHLGINTTVAAGNTQKNTENTSSANAGQEQVAINNTREQNPDPAVQSAPPISSEKQAIKYESPLSVTQKEADEIKRTVEYLQFEQLTQRAGEIKIVADVKKVTADSIRARGEDKIIESQRMVELAAEERNKTKRNQLANEAINLDSEGKNMFAISDSLNKEVKNLNLTANAIKQQADKIIDGLPERKRNELVAVYNNQITSSPVDADQQAMANESGNSKIENKDNEVVTASGNAENAGKNQIKQEVVAPNEPKEKVIGEPVAINKENNAGNDNAGQATPTVTPKSSERIIPEGSVEPTAQKSDQKTTVNEKEKIAAADIPASKAPVVSDSTAMAAAIADIKKEAEYQQYKGLKDEASRLSGEAKATKERAETQKQLAEQEQIKSNDLLEFAAAQKSKSARKDAQNKAIESDNLARSLNREADSLLAVSTGQQVQADSKQKEADDFLKNMDEQKASGYRSVYNGIIPAHLQPSTAAVEREKDLTKTTAKETGVESAANTVQNREGASQNITQPKAREAVLNAPQALPDVKSMPAFLAYQDLMNKAKVSGEQAESYGKRADSLKAAASEKNEQSNLLLEEAASLKKKERKAKVKEAVALDAEANQLTMQADSVRTLSTPFLEEKEKQEQEAIRSLATVDAITALRIRNAYEGKPEPPEALALLARKETTDSSAANRLAGTDKEVLSKPEQNLTAPLTNIRSEKVTRQNKNAYNAGNPIPMNQQLPDGIVFKVQIGAFNRPVDNGAFGGISPVMGEKVGDRNLIRYTAGMFNRFEEAAAARKDLNAMGFNDAFVVAYCYGKRMPVTEARSLTAAGKDCKGSDGATLAANTNVPAKVYTPESSAISSNEAPANEISRKTINVGETLPQQSLQAVKGMVYTVQVGVYSKQVKAGQLYNITPLYYELNTRGQYRYTSGIYNDVKEAVKAKDVIVNIGIKDAFVSAYLNGKRIPMDEAAAVEAREGKAAFANVPEINAQPRTLIQTTAVASSVAGSQPPVNREIKNESESVNPNPGVVNIVYKVQLGAFRKQVPVEVMNKYLSIASKGIDNYKTGDLTIYTVGSFSDYNMANTTKAEVVEAGVTDAFVVAFNNGKKITIEEAAKLKGK